MSLKSSQKDGRLISPLRYPGSKRRLAIYIRQALLLNDISPQLYVEPFAGGASVALQLLNDHMIEKTILMDIDPLYDKSRLGLWSNHEEWDTLGRTGNGWVAGTVL